MDAERILDPARVPDDWETNSNSGIVHPPLLSIRYVGPINGFEIRKDGVYVTEDGVRHKAEWPEDAQIRRMAIDVFGPEIAQMGGIEPE
jgi:hypothetical protein